MKFLIDRCAGHRLAEWLRGQGHEVLEAPSLGPDPGDRALLKRAAEEQRILVTIDKDFGQLLFVERMRSSGVVRLPDVLADERIRLMEQVLQRHTEDLQLGAIVTVRANKIRVSRPPT